MGVSIGSSLGESCCQWIHITLKAAVSKEEPVNPNSWAGSWGCNGLVMLIPCKRHSLQEAFYRVNHVLQTLKWQHCHKTKWRFQQDCSFSKISKPSGHCLRQVLMEPRSCGAPVLLISMSSNLALRSWERYSHGISECCSLVTACEAV